MITRRAFLTALAAVPFVGKLIPQKLDFTEANYRAVVNRQSGIRMRLVKDWYEVSPEDPGGAWVYNHDTGKWTREPFDRKKQIAVFNPNFKVRIQG